MSNYIPQPEAARITPEEFARRRSRLASVLGSDSVAIIPGAGEQPRNSDVLYPFRQDSDFQYLTGFGEPDAWAVIAPGHPDGDFTLFCRPKDKSKEIWDGYRAGPEGCRRDYGADQAYPVAELGKRLPDLLKDRQAVYFPLGAKADWDEVLTTALAGVRQRVRQGVQAPEQVVRLGSLLHEHRLVKSPSELAMMRYAGQVSAGAHARAMQKIHAGQFEYQLAAELHHDFARHGMEMAYPSIVGGGANACVLHYIENRAPFRDGDLCLIDAGAEFQGYCADITRTFPVNGRYSAEQRAVYDIVLEAQLAAIAAVRPGASWMAPHEAVLPVLTQGLVDLGLLQGDVDALIEDGKYQAFFMHKTGHWLGMDVHDVGAYRLSGEWRSLRENMVLTIEPGLYLSADSDGVPPAFAGIGVRIEDDVAVTQDGCEVLTADVPKRIDDIEALMTR